MAAAYTESEMAQLTEAIQTYERLTGLVAHTITYNEATLEIQWAYPDNVWAGSTLYNQPMSAILIKLSRQIKDEYGQLQSGKDQLVHVLAEIQRGWQLSKAQ
jgi:hypothetical protein